MNEREREEAHRYGRLTERVVASWLRGQGWKVIPSYAYSGKEDNKAPMMSGAFEGYVIPDLDVCRNGQRFWIEVKYKADATATHMLGDLLEHGIQLRHFHDYKAVERLSGTPVFLFVYTHRTSKLSCRRLPEEGRIYDGPKMGRGGMIFWPCDSFVDLTTLELPSLEDEALS